MSKPRRRDASSICADLVNQIKHGKVERNISTKELANATGIKESTLYQRLQRPEEFRLDELLNIAKVLCIDFSYRCSWCSTEE